MGRAVSSGSIHVAPLVAQLVEPQSCDLRVAGLSLTVGEVIVLCPEQDIVLVQHRKICPDMTKKLLTVI